MNPIVFRNVQYTPGLDKARTFSKLARMFGFSLPTSHSRSALSITPLMKAALAGDVEGVRANFDKVRKDDGTGGTALMYAARGGHVSCMLTCNKKREVHDGWKWSALLNMVNRNNPNNPFHFSDKVDAKDAKEWATLLKNTVKSHTRYISLLEAEVGMQDKRGWTALMFVAFNGKADCARLLLSEAGKQSTKGCAITLNGNMVIFPPGTTALMLAANYNHPEIVELLLPYEQGMEDSEGHTAKWHACSNLWGGDFTQVRKLLENEGTERAPPPSKEPLMFLASAMTGDVDGIQKNLSCVGYRGPNGTTALMMAAENGQTDSIPFLEKELGMQDEDGWTALMLAALNGKTDCVRLLLSEAGKQTTKTWLILPPGTTALMIAACQNHLEIVQLLLPYERGMTNSKGHTAQWYANNSDLTGDFSQVRKLLENEDLECFSQLNQECINEPSVEVESLEKKSSSSKNFPNEIKKDISNTHTDSDILKKELADQKARILALEEENARLRGESLITAVNGEDLKAIRRRLDQAGQKDSSGMTALMHAASRGQTEVVRLLRPLEARLQDGRGWTALMHAVGRGHEECAGLLLLERDLKDGEGRTAEDVANGLPDGKKKITPLLRKKVHLPDLPDELSSFQLTGKIGRGAFGTVFSAWSEEHGNCALKVVEYEEMERTIVDSLRREMGTIPSLEHPHVLRYHRVHDDPDNGTAYLVMDWCSGTLHDEVRGRGERGEPFRDEEVWRCLREMASGLAYLHEKRYVHRDLKPENVLLSSDGRCVLGDFGLARAIENSSRTKTTAGTPLYMAPEIHRGEKYDKSVDVWALGVMGYEMCTHALPFENVAAVLNETSAPSLEGRPSDLAALISQMLSKDPKDRPTAHDIINNIRCINSE
ncbi:Kinase, NEK [Giardia muris]|uniref:Kinase, NEK n=1 Tax=Giardia muris TaxID=5742 RepID=A0A4Z1SVF9_GIAMU|nr:Kinase, NEK [Giardia muris]|eukprot:TNJ29862.1 Kinase, NEK [Giardia muris]